MIHTLMDIVSILFSGGMTVCWAALVATFCWAGNRHRDALLLFIGTTSGAALTTPLKLVFARPRPPGSPVTDSYSFPSGHALSIAVFLGFLAWTMAARHPHRKIPIYGVAILITTLVCVSRVYLVSHYPSDVLAGVFIGFVYVMVVLRIVRKAPRFGSIDKTIGTDGSVTNRS